MVKKNIYKQPNYVSLELKSMSLPAFLQLNRLPEGLHWTAGITASNASILFIKSMCCVFQPTATNTEGCNT